MAEITAGLVMKLRKMSGQGMMDCKKALQETAGDLDEAMALLRKKGLATLEKRAGRETSEGRVVCRRSDDGRVVALATLCCETDFVSKSDDFVATADILATSPMPSAGQAKRPKWAILYGTDSTAAVLSAAMCTSTTSWGSWWRLRPPATRYHVPWRR